MILGPGVPFFKVIQYLKQSNDIREVETVWPAQNELWAGTRLDKYSPTEARHMSVHECGGVCIALVSLRYSCSKVPELVVPGPGLPSFWVV